MGRTKKEEAVAEILPPLEIHDDPGVYLREKVRGAFPEIVQGFLQKAKDGSAQHMKMALELVEPEQVEEKGAAQLLMEELGLE